MPDLSQSPRILSIVLTKIDWLKFVTSVYDYGLIDIKIIKLFEINYSSSMNKL